MNSEFKDLLRALNEARVRYLVVGGYAERDERVRSGEETPVDWETATKELRDRLTC